MFRTFSLSGSALLRGGRSLLLRPDVLLRRHPQTFLSAVRCFADDAAAAKDLSAIVDVTEANVQQMVMESPVPVILDCYADWCEPCKQLTPVLERAVQQSKGKLRLAKLNVEQEKKLSQQLQVKSLPTVYGVYKGQMVDHFVGLRGEEELANFLQKLEGLADGSGAAAAEGEEAAEANNPMQTAAALLNDGDPEGAAAMYKEIYAGLTSGDEKKKKDAESLKQQFSCLVGLASCALASGDGAAVAELLQLLKTKHALEIAADPALASAVASLELAAAAPGGVGAGASAVEGGADPAEALEAAVKANPEDLESRLQLAQLRFQQSCFEEAIEHALAIVKVDSAWQDAAGKELLLKFFASLGSDHDLVKSGRKRLTNLLFV
jgi:putative thioredoxin